MERKGECCFCGKSFNDYGNDIRPLVNDRGDRCCNDCNIEIVIPNRMKFWNTDYFYVIYIPELNSYFADDEPFSDYVYTDKISQAMTFGDELLATRFILQHNKKGSWIVKRILLREDD